MTIKEKNTIKEITKKLNSIAAGRDFKHKKGLFFSTDLEYKHIKDCYQKPSRLKYSIYVTWLNKLKHQTDELLKFGVKGFNGFFISLHALAEIDNTIVYIVINPSTCFFKVIK